MLFFVFFIEKSPKMYMNLYLKFKQIYSIKYYLYNINIILLQFWMKKLKFRPFKNLIKTIFPHNNMFINTSSYIMMTYFLF